MCFNQVWGLHRASYSLHVDTEGFKSNFAEHFADTPNLTYWPEHKPIVPSFMEHPKIPSVELGNKLAKDRVRFFEERDVFSLFLRKCETRMTKLFQ